MRKLSERIVTVTGGNEAGADLVLVQPFLLCYVNHVLMLTSIFLSIISIRKRERFVSKQGQSPPHIHSKAGINVKWSIVWKEKFHWKKRLVFESLDWRNHHFVEYHCFFYYYYSYLELNVLRKRPYRTKGSLKLTTSSVSGGKGVHWMRVDLKTNTFKSKIQLVSVFKKVKLWFIWGASESGRSISTFLKPFHVINWKWVETNILVHWGESFINIPSRRTYGFINQSSADFTYAPVFVYLSYTRRGLMWFWYSDF